MIIDIFNSFKKAKQLETIFKEGQEFMSIENLTILYMVPKLTGEFFSKLKDENNIGFLFTKFDN